MRITSAILLIGCAAFVVGCSSGSSSACSGSGAASGPDVPSDAVAAADTQILNAGFKKCGEYWGGEHPRDMGMVATDYQLNNLRIRIQNIGGRLSDADKLNGVE